MIGDVHKCESRRPRVTLVEMKETNNGKAYAMLVRSLIVFVATVLVICCVLLLYLYLIVRSEEPNTVTENQLGNSSSWISKRHSYYGGSCWSTDCLHAASDLLNSIDPSIDPCKDFYQYACGGWMKKNPRPPTAPRWDPFEKLTAENNEWIEMLLKNRELKALYYKEEAVWKASAYYDSCMDVEEIERLKGKPLQDLIRNYGSWSITDKGWVEHEWHLINNLARIHRDLALQLFFQTKVDIDNENSSQYAIMLKEAIPLTSLSRRRHLTNDVKSTLVREAFKDLMRNLTRKLGAEQSSESDLMKVFEFERELVEVRL